MKKVLSFWVICILFTLSTSSIRAAYNELGKIKLFGPIGEYASQYSPWVMHEPGWGSYVMYYCKNTPLNGVYRDRVWRIENWNDGINGDWVNDTPVIEGALNQNDDLSCSPGVVIGPDGKWHMYYITADRNSGCNVYIYHATADAPGIEWQKTGPITVDGTVQMIPNCGAETPSPFMINGKYILFYLSGQGKMVRLESSDGQNFTNKTIINSPDPYSSPWRIMISNSVYYMLLGKGPNDGVPKDQILISKSSDGINFSQPELLMSSNGTDWDGDRMWTPNGLIINNILRIYYAANIGTYPWFGSNTSIGLRWFEMPPTILGDLNGDNHVNLSDLEKIISSFGNPYTIFDYNNLVANFGK